MKSICGFVTRVVIVVAIWATMGAFAQDVTWDGNGDADNSGNWSDDANWDTAAPTTIERAMLPSVTTGTRTITQDTALGTTANALRFVQDNPDGISKLSLDGNLTLSKSARESATLSGTTSALQWDLSGGATQDQALIDLNGLSILTTGIAPSGATTGGNLGGIINFNEAGSSIYSSMAGHLSWNLFGTIHASADGMVGKNTGGTNNTGNGLFTIQNGATIDVTAGVFALSVAGRRGQDRALTVNNNGTINVSSGATLEESWQSFTSSTNRGLLVFNNGAAGELSQAGTVQFKAQRDAAGNATSTTINNNGLWTVSGSNAALRQMITADDAATIVVPAFNNNATGTLRGVTANDTLEFNEEGANGNRMTITNLGIIQPGAGSQGAGTLSIGTLALRDINVTDSAGTIELDIGGSGEGAYDRLSLLTGASDPAGAGTLDLTAGTGTLQLWKVNGFAPAGNFEITLIDAGSVMGTFGTVKLDSVLFSGSSLDADGGTYTVNYNADSVTLSYIPEPATVGLIGIGLLLVVRRRRARS